MAKTPLSTIIPMLSLVLGGCANLQWVEPKVYIPTATQIQVEKLGIDGPVEVLPVGTSSIAINHQLTNQGRVAVPAGYEITETVIQWVFRRNITSVGWMPGNPATHTVVVLTQPGPALAPGETKTVSFDPIPVNSCGLYSETLLADVNNVVRETSQNDNEDVHLFFVPSRQRVDIAVNTLTNAIYHKDGRTNTHTFTITSPAVPPNQWLYTGFSYIATEGSTADAVPPPAPGVVAGPGPQVVNMFVNPKDHDIPRLGFVPTVKGKLTAISTDGCIITQKVGEVYVEHD